MGKFMFQPDISVGDLLTITSVIISIIALLISWQKDRELKQKEYADQVRRAVGVIIAKLERRRELTLRFFEDIQPLITEVDMNLTKEQNLTVARDLLWRELVDMRAKSSQRIIDEQIEIAYMELYGYDPSIRILFSEAIERLKLIDQRIYVSLLELTQVNIVNLQNVQKPFYSAQLGNILRVTCHYLETESDRLMNEIVVPFRQEMIKLIEGTDRQIFKKNICVAHTQNVYSSDIENLNEQVAELHSNLLRQIVKPLLALDMFKSEISIDYEPTRLIGCQMLSNNHLFGRMPSVAIGRSATYRNEKESHSIRPDLSTLKDIMTDL